MIFCCVSFPKNRQLGGGRGGGWKKVLSTLPQFISLQAAKEALSTFIFIQSRILLFCLQDLPRKVMKTVFSTIDSFKFLFFFLTTTSLSSFALTLGIYLLQSIMNRKPRFCLQLHINLGSCLNHNTVSSFVSPSPFHSHHCDVETPVTRTEHWYLQHLRDLQGKQLTLGSCLIPDSAAQVAVAACPAALAEAGSHSNCLLLSRQGNSDFVSSSVSQI